MSAIKGMRIRLDLSSINNILHKYQWLFIQRDKVSTVSDLSEYIAERYFKSLKTVSEAIHNHLELYLEEPFILPPSEDINILQNGDLVIVKIRDKDLGGSEFVSNTSKNSKQTNTEERTNIETSSSSDTEKDNNLLKKKSTKENECISKESPNAHKEPLKINNKSIEKQKNKSGDETSSSCSSSTSSSSDSDTTNRLRYKAAVTKIIKDNLTLSRTSINKSELLKKKHNSLVTNNGEGCSSSTDSEIPEEKATTKFGKVSSNVSKTDSGAIKGDDHAKNNISQNLYESSSNTTDTSSSESEESNNETPSERNKKAIESIVAPIEALEESSPDVHKDSKSGITRKRKRKRKRKSKNKNKIRKLSDSGVVDPKPKDSFLICTNANDCNGAKKQVEQSNPHLSITKQNSKTHIYFTDEDDNEEVMETSKTQPSLSPTQAATKKESLDLAKMTDVENESVLPIPKIQSLVPNINCNGRFQSSKPETTRGSFQQTYKKKLQSSSRNVSCEEVLLGNSYSGSHYSNGIENSNQLTSTKNNTKNPKPRTLISQPIQAATPPLPSYKIPLSNDAVENDFSKLLNIANSTPLRVSRDTKCYNPATNSIDVWSNRSTIHPGTKIHTENGFQGKDECYSDMPVLKSLPDIGDRIAFKVLEISDDYTPTLSGYKVGTVYEIFSKQNMLKVELDPQFIKGNKQKEGKFELPDSELDESYDNSQGTQKSFQWTELYEPKKVIQ